MYPLLVALLLVLVSCSSSNIEETEISVMGAEDIDMELDSLEGMIRVHSLGKIAQLGTNDFAAKANERPQMNSSFEYDFSMGRHEVSCGEYNKLMRGFAEASCDDEFLPVSNVTFYDAVLYANERSKSENMDTAYSYSVAVFDDEKHCVSLEGFSYNSAVDAYRLPTEAEWIFVAASNWQVSKGWSAGNSGYKAHAVCSALEITENQNGDKAFCDFTGNVSEWVNDWLGYFQDTTFSNYVGASDGGGLGQRVLKGGNFSKDGSSTTLYARGDVYTVTSSTKTNYVGFRLAFGRIPGATWVSSNGVASSSPIIPVAASTSVQKLTGTFRTKLAFRNDVTGNLAFLDYSSGALSVTEILDSIDVYHPEISPNGKHVAFCTGLEGVSGKSSLYVRDLNAKGTNLVQLDVESAAIPRWKVLPTGDTVIVYVTGAGNNKSDVDFAGFSTWQVTFSNGTFGTPEKLFDGAYHGGISYDDRLAVTGARLLRARVPQEGSFRDTVWYNGEQACNVSLSRDSSKRTLFLDFGGKTGRSFADANYGTHEMLLIVDSVGTLVQGVPAPSGYSFDHNEWAVNDGVWESRENLVVATLTNGSGAHTKIVLLNVADSSVTELVSGDELWHPSLWVQPSFIPEESDVDPDSAGIYYTSQVLYYGLELRIKMERFWMNRDRITTVALGSSRTLFGLYDKAVLSEYALNMGFSSGDLYGASYLMKNYVLKHLPKLKTVIIEVSPDFFITDENSSWNPLYKTVPGYKYDENHGFWEDGVPENFESYVQEAPKPVEILSLPYDPDEFLLPTNSWGTATISRDSSLVSLENGSGLQNMKLLMDMIDAAKKAQLNVVCTFMPINPGYAQTGAYGIYGTQRSVALDIMKLLRENGVVVFDENRMGDHDYSDDMAYNTDHLSRKGAMQFTARLDSLLKTLR